MCDACISLLSRCFNKAIMPKPDCVLEESRERSGAGECGETWFQDRYELLGGYLSCFLGTQRTFDWIKLDNLNIGETPYYLFFEYMYKRYLQNADVRTNTTSAYTKTWPDPRAMRDFSSFFSDRPGTDALTPVTGTGSGGGARPGGDVAWRGDAARSPASNHAAYPGNSGSSGPSLGDAEICEAPPSPGTTTSLPAAPTGPQGPRTRRSHSRCRVRVACWLGRPWLPRVEPAERAFQTHTWGSLVGETKSSATFIWFRLLRNYIKYGSKCFSFQMKQLIFIRLKKILWRALNGGLRQREHRAYFGHVG